MENQILRTGMKMAKELVKKEYTIEEVIQMKENHFQNGYRLQTLQAKLKELQAEIKAEQKVILKENERIMEVALKGYEYVEMEVRLVADDQLRIIEFFTVEGEKVGERQQYPHERIFNI